MSRRQRRFLKFSISMALVPGLVACTRTGWTHQPQGRMNDGAVVESSGVAASRQFKGVYWTHNDDGPAEIFAVRENGRLIASYTLPGKKNMDWEDIAVDDSGMLYVFDNTPRVAEDHAGLLHILREPDPSRDREVGEFRTIRVEFPPGGWDVETLIVRGGKAFFVNKPWDASEPRIFRLENLDSDGKVEIVGTVPVRAMITGGDISADGKKIALSSYRALYIFEGEGDPVFLLESVPLVCPLNARQVEGISWEGNDLILTNEQREVFRVDESQWRKRDAPFLISRPESVPFLARKPLIGQPLESWAHGKWLKARTDRGTFRIARVAWSEWGLHIGVLLPSDLSLGSLTDSQYREFADWFTPGRVYILFNPAGDRPLVFGANDRCIVIGTSPEGESFAQARHLGPATFVGYQETRPAWVEVETRDRLVLVTLKTGSPGFSELVDKEEIGFNLLVMGEDGRQLSWTPLLTPFSFDSPSLWGLLELER